MPAGQQGRARCRVGTLGRLGTVGLLIREGWLMGWQQRSTVLGRRDEGRWDWLMGDPKWTWRGGVHNHRKIRIVENVRKIKACLLSKFSSFTIKNILPVPGTCVRMSLWWRLSRDAVCYWDVRYDAVTNPSRGMWHVNTNHLADALWANWQRIPRGQATHHYQEWD